MDVQNYKKKTVNTKIVAAIVVGVLLFCVMTLTAVTVHHIVTDGITAEADYRFQSYEAEEI